MAFDASTAHFWLGDEDLGKFELEKQPVGEARFFKKTTGLTPLQMVQGFEIADPDCFAAMVWLLKFRKNQRLDFATLDFAMGDITIKDENGNTPGGDADATADPTPAAAASTSAASPAGTSNVDVSSISSPSLTSAISDLPTSTS